MRPLRALGPSLLALILVSGLALPSWSAEPASSGVTTVIVVRHAEKDKTDKTDDPPLSEPGQRRAEALASVLDGAGVSAIYVTPTKRTRATAGPVAKQAGLTLLERPATPASGAGYAVELAREVLEKQKGKTVLIVGHSNTVPDIVKAFSHVAVPELTDADYDRLFIVEVPAEGPARLFKVRYGEANP